MIKNNILHIPKAKKINHDVIFGKVDGENRGSDPMTNNIIKNDEYYWLRDDTRKNEDILDYIKSENNYINNNLFNNENKLLLNKIQQNIKNRINENYISFKHEICQVDNKYTYKLFWRNIEENSHKFHYIEIKDNITLENKEYLLLDENKLKEKYKKCNIVNLTLSDDKKLLLYAMDNIGNEIYNLYIFNINNLNNHVNIVHEIPSILYGTFLIEKSSRYIFYSQCNEYNRVNKIFIYDLFTRKNKKIFEDSNELNSINFWFSNDKEILFIESENYSNNTIYYLNLINLDFDNINLNIIQKETRNYKYKIEKISNYFIILTNKLGNTNFIPMFCKISNNTSEYKWKFINKNKLETKLDIKDDDIIFFDKIFTLKEYVIFSIRHNGVTKIIFIKFINNDIYPFEKDWNIISPYDKTGVVYLNKNEIYDTKKINIVFSSLTTPNVYISCDLETFVINIDKQDIIPNYNEKLYKSDRIYALTENGIKIPISIVYKKNINITNGPHKLHLYAYGSYGHIIDTNFNKDIITLLDEGYIYAIAHVRGGGFLGNKWYEDGKMLKKMNTFLDIECVAKYLISINYTSSKLMSFEGRSAGGLLAGYCLVKLNNLFNSIIACVPFVDVLTTMSDATIPLTTGEWKQWGNPNEEEFYNYMSIYSPYDNIIKNMEYPHFYITGGLHDPRVQYWEPTKFVAKLRDNQIYLKNKLQFLEIKMNEGHFNSNNRYKNVEEISKKILFLLKSIN